MPKRRNERETFRAAYKSPSVDDLFPMEPSGEPVKLRKVPPEGNQQDADIQSESDQQDGEMQRIRPVNIHLSGADLLALDLERVERLKRGEPTNRSTLVREALILARAAWAAERDSSGRVRSTSRSPAMQGDPGT
jgi:hypothetical protein